MSQPSKYELQGSNLLVSGEAEGGLDGIQVLLGCVKCQQNFSSPDDLISHVKSGQCKPPDTTPKRGPGRPRKNPLSISKDTAGNIWGTLQFEDEAGKSRPRKKQKTDEIWTPSAPVIASETPGRRVTRVSTGSMQRKSIVDLIEDASSRRDKIVEEFMTPPPAPKVTEDGSTVKRGRGRPRKIKAEDMVGIGGNPGVVVEGDLVFTELKGGSDVGRRLIETLENKTDDDGGPVASVRVEPVNAEPEVMDLKLDSGEIVRLNMYDDDGTPGSTGAPAGDMAKADVTVGKSKIGDDRTGTDLEATVTREGSVAVGEGKTAATVSDAVTTTLAGSSSDTVTAASSSSDSVTAADSEKPGKPSMMYVLEELPSDEEDGFLDEGALDTDEDWAESKEARRVMLSDKGIEGVLDGLPFKITDADAMATDSQDPDPETCEKPNQDSTKKVTLKKPFPYPHRRRTTRSYKCPRCTQRFFYTPEELQLHYECHVPIEEDKGPKPLYRCYLCKYEATLWNRCLDHMAVHEEIRKQFKNHKIFKNILGEYKCTLCDKVFDRKINIKCHFMNVHNKVERQCNVCGKVLSNSDLKTFKRHVEKCQGVVYVCSFCPYKTTVRANLRKHENIHTGKGFECEVCSSVFPTKQRLKAHADIHNANRRKYMCENCGQEFASQDAVQKHVIRVHSGQCDIYGCDQCKFTAKLLIDLKKHINVVHNKRFKCGLCPFQSNSHVAMTQHNEFHKPDRQFPCPYENCYYRGPSSRHLNSHVNQKHRSASKHQCPICHKLYKKKTHLARHLVSHTGDKPYTCLDCHATFSTHSSYYRHKHKTGHDAKREGVVSVPQNITIQYISPDSDFQLIEEQPGGIAMEMEPQAAMEELVKPDERRKIVMLEGNNGEKWTYVVEVDGNDNSTDIGEEELAQLLQRQFQNDQMSPQSGTTSRPSVNVQTVHIQNSSPGDNQNLESHQVTAEVVEGHEVTGEEVIMQEVSCDDSTNTPITMMSIGGQTIEVHHFGEHKQDAGPESQEEVVTLEYENSLAEDTTTLAPTSQNDLEVVSAKTNLAVCRVEGGHVVYETESGLQGIQAMEDEDEGETVEIQGHFVDGAETVALQALVQAAAGVEDGQTTAIVEDIHNAHKVMYQDSETGYETIVEIEPSGGQEESRREYAIVVMPDSEPEAALGMLQLQAGNQSQ